METHVASFVSFSIFSFSHKDVLVASGYVANGHPDLLKNMEENWKRKIN
jgi:hypothetical protein